MVFYSSDPVRDAERHAAAQDELMDRLPKCADCGYPIQTEHFYCIEGKKICPVCLEDNYRRDTRDYLE